MWITRVSIQNVSFTTEGMRDTRQSMTCNLPRKILQQHNDHVNFESIRPADSDFSKLPPGGAVQTYAVSVSNNGRVFGSSQTYTLLFNSTCMSCDDSGPVQLVSVFANCLTWYLLFPYSLASRYLLLLRQQITCCFMCFVYSSKGNSSCSSRSICGSCVM